MRPYLAFIICCIIAFAFPMIIYFEYKFLTGLQFGKFGATLTMIFCILFAVGIYPKLSEHFRENW